MATAKMKGNERERESRGEIRTPRVYVLMYCVYVCVHSLIYRNVKNEEEMY